MILKRPKETLNSLRIDLSDASMILTGPGRGVLNKLKCLKPVHHSTGLRRFNKHSQKEKDKEKLKGGPTSKSSSEIGAMD
jgi:hypothetical protein